MDERLFGWRHAFDSPVTVWLCGAIGALLVLAPLVTLVLAGLGRIGDAMRREVIARWATWIVLAVVLCVPILLGAAWWIGCTLLLSIALYREYARATGLFRERAISAVVVAGILLVYFAVLDHWYGLFLALFPLVTITICAVAIGGDRPKGYIQRVALGIFGFALFGCALGHLGYLANDRNYRPIVLSVLVAVELNDVFAFLCGKTFGHRKLVPQTSPNKTVGGALGALCLTTTLFALLAHAVWKGTPLDHPLRLATLGILCSVGGQLGDLMLSSIKRDLGLRDTGAVLPGHGGLLDRFDSLLLVAPAVFHYVGYHVGIGLDQPARILTGGG